MAINREPLTHIHIIIDIKEIDMRLIHSEAAHNETGHLSQSAIKPTDLVTGDWISMHRSLPCQQSYQKWK